VILDVVYEAGIEHELVYSKEWRAYCGIAGGD